MTITISKQKFLLLLAAAALALTMAFTAVATAVPVVRVKPNKMVSVRCVSGPIDEVIIDFTPDDGVDVTCRVWVIQEQE